MARRKDELPTSRVRRTARLGSLAAGQAVRQAGTRAANVARSDEAAEAATARRQLETAEQIVDALGTMKGAAMKVGQVLSFLDVGLVPEEHREAFQVKLAELRDAAPKVAFKDMKKVVEREYGERIDRTFASFDPVPVAAASIGQVYRARLEDGRDVAVKVQYPGVAAAVRADLQNLGLILRLARSVAPGLDVQAVAGEIRERIEEELDYELEASNQRALARVYRGHPFILIPDVVTELSREKVIVSEWVEGRSFAGAQSMDDVTRNRLGEVVYRFYFGSMYRFRMFSADPHPGNMLVVDPEQPKVAFLDFGLFKRLPAATAEFELKVARLGIERRGEELLAHLAQGGIIGDPARYTPELVLQQFDDFSRWQLQPGVTRLHPRVAAAVMAVMSDPRSPYFSTMRHETLAPDHLAGRRLEYLTLAVLCQLECEADWSQIAREWIYGEAPQTALGEQEAAWLAARAA